jgi:glycosyltransferase involved in cell wall biosynthesis
MTTSKPLVSIIIPYYNHNNYLDEALASVAAQTYPNLEIILIDDGSKLPYVSSMPPSIRLTHIRQDNQGQGVARNRGARVSNGELLAFLDADDIWDPDKIEKQVELFDRFPEAVAVYCDYRTIDGDGNVTQRTSALGTPRPSGFILPQLLFGNCVGSPSVVMVQKKPFIEAGGFNETFSRAAEDYTLWLALSALGTFIYECTTRASYRRHESQTSGTPDFYLKRARGNFDALRRVNLIMSDMNDDINSLFREKLLKAAITLNWAARKANHRKEALIACVEALKLRPWRVDLAVLFCRSMF